MERELTPDRMLKHYACTNAALSCVIGNIFAEISPPCEDCGADRITICGQTVTGNVGMLIVTKAGFDFEGCAEDTALIDRIQKERCIYARKGAGTERTFGIQCNCEMQGHDKAHIHDYE